MDCNTPGSSTNGIFQARILEWVAIFYSRGSSQPRYWTHTSCISCVGRCILNPWATWEAQSFPTKQTFALLKFWCWIGTELIQILFRISREFQFSCGLEVLERTGCQGRTGTHIKCKIRVTRWAGVLAPHSFLFPSPHFWGAFSKTEKRGKLLARHSIEGSERRPSVHLPCSLFTHQPQEWPGAPTCSRAVRAAVDRKDQEACGREKGGDESKKRDPQRCNWEVLWREKWSDILPTPWMPCVSANTKLSVGSYAPPCHQYNHGLCVKAVIVQTRPAPGAASILPHWISLGSMHPGPPRLPGRGSQTLTCLKITLEQSIMAHQGVTSSNLGWGPEACIELPPGPGRLVVLFFFFFFDPWNQPACLCLRPSTLGKAPPVTPPPQDTSGLLHPPAATLSSPSRHSSHQPSLWPFEARTAW